MPTTRHQSSANAQRSIQDMADAAERPVEKVEKKIKLLKRWDTEYMVTLEAVNDLSQKPQKIHRDVACHYSPIFKAAFNSNFVEGRTQTYRLEDVGFETVKSLIHWMYHQELDIGTPATAETKSLTDRALIKLWILADKLLIPTLQNMIIRELDRQRKKYRAISTSCIPYVYEKTAEGSSLRKLFVSWTAWDMDKKRLRERPEHFPKEMLIDLSMELLRRMPKEEIRAQKAFREIRHFDVEVGEDSDIEMG